LSFIFPTFNDCIGLNLPGEKSHQVFKTIIHPVRHADTSGSLMRVEQLLRQLGIILIALSTASVQPTGHKADNHWFLFMKSKGKSEKGLLFKRCSNSVQNPVQMPVTSFKCGSNIHDLSVQKSRVKGD